MSEDKDYSDNELSSDQIYESLDAKKKEKRKREQQEKEDKKD